MKKFIALTLATIGVATSARAQWVVYDPTLHTQSILNTAQEIAKYIDMINNQLQQIHTQTTQLNQFKHYEDLFGEPKSVLTAKVKAAATDAEVQKLTGVLIGLSSALNNTDYEINQATTSAVVQDIANRNDTQRQIEAKKEQQHAEFTEAVRKYGQTFRLLNEP